MKKKLKLLIGLPCGIHCTWLVLAGLSLLLFPQQFARVFGIVEICLSFATGIILPNPVSPVYLSVGILLLVLPKALPASILLCLGVGGAIANAIVWTKNK